MESIQERSFQFAVHIVRFCKLLRTERKEFTLSRQLLRSGTSIAANLTEAQHAQSKADFQSKVNIALKEAVETEYWLRLLYATDYLSKTEFASIADDCGEIARILTASVKTLKK